MSQHAPGCCGVTVQGPGCSAECTLVLHVAEAHTVQSGQNYLLLAAAVAAPALGFFLPLSEPAVSKPSGL
jgi:hypothetical protein